MSIVPQATSGKNMPAPERRNTVFMGRLDFLSTLLRLIGVELYKLRRRAMSKVFSAIAILVILSTFVLIATFSLIILSEPTSDFLPAPCSAVHDPSIQPCLDHPPTPLELMQAEQAKRERIQSISSPLRLPESFMLSAQIVNSIGLVFMIILAGTIVGGEYSVGTVRLMFTRGPTRTQFLLSKLGALIVCITLGLTVLTLIGIVTGSILSLIIGTSTSFSFLTGTWILHTVLYLLSATLGLFVYAMIATCLSTLGKASAAGIAGGLVWWGLEGILGLILNAISAFNQGPLGDLLKAVPDYFISNNVEALLQNQSQYLQEGQPSRLSDLHALLVLIGYLAIFIGLSWWVNKRRDVTN